MPKITLNAKQRTSITSSLINNGCGCWTEGDRAYLDKFDDERFYGLAVNAARGKRDEEVLNHLKTKLGVEYAEGALATEVIPLFDGKLAANARGPDDDDDEDDDLLNLNCPGDGAPAGAAAGGEEPVAEEEEEGAPAAPPAKGKKPMPPTGNQGVATDVQKWMDGAPPLVRAAVRNAMETEARDRRTLRDQLKGIVANERDPARKALIERELKKNLTAIDLRKLVTLVGPTSNRQAPPQDGGTGDPDLDALFPDYTGASGGGGPTANAGGVQETDEVLPPVMNMDWAEINRQNSKRRAMLVGQD